VTSDVDHCLRRLGRETKPPIGPGDPIPQFEVFAVRRQPDPANEPRSALGARNDQKIGVALCALAAEIVLGIGQAVGRWCPGKLREYRFVADRSRQRRGIFRPAGPEQQSFSPCKHEHSPRLCP